MNNNNKTNPQGSTPVPDPTVLTTQQLTREIAASREIVEAKYDTKLAAMDEATRLNKEASDKVPCLIKQEVKNLRDLHEEKFTSISVQFKERDIRAEREARDNKVAVDAAFAAQKEAAAKQDEANAKAIEKSERATTETIKTNQELSLSKIEALTSQMNDLKGRLDRGEGNAGGRQENRLQLNQIISWLVALGAIAVATISVILK